MTYAPNAADFALVFLFAVLASLEVWLFAVLWQPRASDGDRTRVYVYLIVYQWALVACIAGLWIVEKRPWSALLLGRPNPWGFAVGLLLAAAYIGLAIWQCRKVFTSPRFIAAARRQLRSVEPMVPHTAAEWRLWPAAALTAGCCEEILFRGFLTALVASFTSLAVAVVVSVVAFGLFHAYYGPKGILKTGGFGLVMSLIALFAHSLIPVILIHAAVDFFSGDVGYRLISTPVGEAAPASS
jgi:uncharacterized protein